MSDFMDWGRSQMATIFYASGVAEFDDYRAYWIKDEIDLVGREFSSIVITSKFDNAHLHQIAKTRMRPCPDQPTPSSS